jgi:Tfp pilus assembly protein PilF
MIAAGSPHDLRLHAEAEAIKALQIDPFSAEAHAALGFARHYDLRWPEAEHEFRRAIELNPSFALAHVWYANFLASRSRMKEALTQMAAARELDPFSLVVNTNMGWVLDETGRPEAAIAELTQTLTLDSNYVQARWRLAVALLSAQRVAEAQRQVTRLITLTDSAPPVLALLAIIDARAGQQDAARAILRDLQSRARGQYVPASSIAQVQAAVGDMNDAMTSMEKAFAEGSNSIAYLAVAREYEPMRRDPRFTSLLKRAGL